MSPSTQGRTCAFCAMLALRGFAYTNQEAAGGEGNAFHHDCDCRIIPTWGEQTLPNYDWRKYERWYEKTKELLEAGGTSYRDSLREMRRLHLSEFSVWAKAVPNPVRRISTVSIYSFFIVSIIYVFS